MVILSTLVAPVAAYLGDLERRRRHRRTERMIGALPAEMLKDIGWPGSARGLDEERRERPAMRPGAC